MRYVLARHLFRRKIISSLAVVHGCILVAARADACKFSDPGPNPGPIGAVDLYGDQGPIVTSILRNAAFVVRERAESKPDPVAVAKNLETDQELLANSVLSSQDGSVRIVKLEADLEPGQTYGAWRWGFFDGSYQASDIVDHQAPGAPVIDSGSVTFHNGESTCQSDSCGDYTVMNLSVAAPTDDHASAEQLVYAVYVGKTAKGAQTAQAPMAILSAVAPGELFAFVDDDLDQRDVFVTLTAIDMAGNESERSAARKVNAAPSSGCAAVRSRTNAIAALPIAVMLAWFLRRRPRRGLGFAAWGPHV